MTDTFKNILDFLATYWVLVAFIIGIVVKLWDDHYKIKEIKSGDVKQIKDHLTALDFTLVQHHKEDAEMEKNLTAKIEVNRNNSIMAAEVVKDKLETATKLMNDKFTHIGETMVKVETKLDLIIEGKIKINGNGK